MLVFSVAVLQLVASRTRTPELEALLYLLYQYNSTNTDGCAKRSWWPPARGP
jgi:hypothetical protein